MCGVADTPSPPDGQKGAKGAAMCLLLWLQKLCAVPVLRTLIGDLLLQMAEGELRTLQHHCIVCKVIALRTSSSCSNTIAPGHAASLDQSIENTPMCYLCPCTQLCLCCIEMTLVGLIAVCVWCLVYTRVGMQIRAVQLQRQYFPLICC